MAKKQSRKNKQQRRQAASERQRQRRAEREAEQPVTDVPPELMSPGDRLNATIAEIGRKLDQSPFAARMVAFAVDYLLCGMLTIVPLLIAYKAAGGSETMSNLTDLQEVGMGMGAIAGVLLAALAISFAYFVLVPLKLLPGRTPGKRLLKLEVVMLDGTPATFGALALRWAFMTFVETLLTFVSGLAIQFGTMLLNSENVGNAYSMVGMGVSLITLWRIWAATPDRRALHDLVAGTWVYTEAAQGKKKRSKASKGNAGGRKARRS